jgi:Ca2+-binding RTX toxin-like protein
MGHSSLRRMVAFLASATMLATLTVATVALPAAAQGTCDGRAATITDNDGDDADPTIGIIEGSNGPDVIVGSGLNDIIKGLGGRDIICGDLGDDVIDGGGGNDRIFGGSGADLLIGGDGHDDLFGFAGGDTINGGSGRDLAKGGGGGDTIRGNGGNDILQGNGGTDLLRGQAGNDRLDGGLAVDDCTQGPGTGPVRRCELADLRVSVLCPAIASEGLVTCKFKVTNRGPDGSGYFLDPGDDQAKGGNTVICEEPDDFVGPTLRPGGTRTRDFVFDCEITGQPPVVYLEAEVDAFARDPKPGNDSAEDRVDFAD